MGFTDAGHFICAGPVLFLQRRKQMLLSDTLHTRSELRVVPVCF